MAQETPISLEPLDLGPRTINETSSPAVPSAGAAFEAPPSPEAVLRARCLVMAAATSTWQAARSLGVPYTTAKRWVSEERRGIKRNLKQGRPKGSKNDPNKPAGPRRPPKPTKGQIAKAKFEASETLAGLTQAANYPLAEAERARQVQAAIPVPVFTPPPPPQPVVSPAPTPYATSPVNTETAPALKPLPGCEAETVTSVKVEGPTPRPVQYDNQPLVAYAAQVLLWRLIKDADTMEISKAIKAFDLVTDKLIMMTAARIDADVLRTGKTNEPDAAPRELAQSASPSVNLAPATGADNSDGQVTEADWEPADLPTLDLGSDRAAN